MNLRKFVVFALCFFILADGMEADARRRKRRRRRRRRKKPVPVKPVEKPKTRATHAFKPLGAHELLFQEFSRRNVTKQTHKISSTFDSYR